MHWFLLAMIGPALWSVSNHLDKYLIETFFKGRGVGALIIFSSIIGAFILPFILLIEPDVLNITPWLAGVNIFNGVLSILAILIYLYALQKDDASTVVPLFQVIPIFAFVLGYLFLGETLSAQQILGSVLVIAGSVALSLDLEHTKPKLKYAVFFLMLLSSLLIAVCGLIFKTVALETTFWVSTFWDYIGGILIGLLFITCIPRYRVEFLKVLKVSKATAFGLNAFNEIINVVGVLTFRSALMLAPIALVWTVNGFQPFFVLLLGILLTVFFPKIGTESLLRRHLIQKIVAIVVMFIGTYLINT
jgi:uncharacterized membrane protein